MAKVQRSLSSQCQLLAQTISTQHLHRLGALAEIVPRH